MILSPEDALDGLQKAIGLVKKAQAVAKDLGGLGVMVGRLFDAKSQATKAMVQAKRSGNKSNFAIAMQIENALMNTAKLESQLQMLYMQTGNVDVWNKIKARAAEMDRDDAIAARDEKLEEKRLKEKEQRDFEIGLAVGGVIFVLFLIVIGLIELKEFCDTTRRCGR
jgi:hypothetical protein